MMDGVMMNYQKIIGSTSFLQKGGVVNGNEH